MTKKPWFRGKKHGYGWGKPTGKEGWLVLVSYLLLLYLCILQLGMNTSSRSNGIVIMIFQVIFITFLLLVICYVTGETLEWQWEKKESHKK